MAAALANGAPSAAAARMGAMRARLALRRVLLLAAVLAACCAAAAWPAALLLLPARVAARAAWRAARLAVALLLAVTRRASDVLVTAALMVRTHAPCTRLRARG